MSSDILLRQKVMKLNAAERKLLQAVQPCAPPNTPHAVAVNYPTIMRQQAKEIALIFKRLTARPLICPVLSQCKYECGHREPHRPMNDSATCCLVVPCTYKKRPATGNVFCVATRKGMRRGK